jgi:hypothetical protein
MTGGWRKLHEDFHHFHSSTNIIKMIKSRTIRWAGHVATMGKVRNAHKLFVGKPEGKKLLLIRRRKSDDNIEIDLRETGLGGCVLD